MSGLWRVLITLQPPRRPDTQAWAGPLRASLRRAQVHTTVEDREIWEYRLANLDARRDLPVDVPQAPATVAAPTGHGGRVKRGLLNFVGELSRVLFGTATSDEVHALQESIKRLQDGMTVLHHNTRVMVSIVNQTRRYVRENRLDLRAVQAETMRLDQLARGLPEESTPSSSTRAAPRSAAKSTWPSNRWRWPLPIIVYNDGYSIDNACRWNGAG